jgi:hypothetical protein
MDGAKDTTQLRFCEFICDELLRHDYATEAACVTQVRCTVR